MKIKRQALHGISSSRTTWWNLNDPFLIERTRIQIISLELLIEDEIPNPMAMPNFSYKSACFFDDVNYSILGVFE